MKGILFRAPMVRAINVDRKTQTRRTQGLEAANAMQGLFEDAPKRTIKDDGSALFEFSHDDDGVERVSTFRARHKIGERIYVKETYYAWGRWEQTATGRLDSGDLKYTWHFVDLTTDKLLGSEHRRYRYAADEHIESMSRNSRQAGWYKRPAIHMPKRASRHVLEIVDVRCEKLREISESDAIAEGVKNSLHMQGGRFANENFAQLWDSINGDGSFNSTDWVFIYEFSRVAQ